MLESEARFEGHIESLQPTHKQLNLGINLEGGELGRFAEVTAVSALSIWEEINTRRSDANQTITALDYRYFAEQVGHLSPNVLRLGINWSQSEDPSKKPLGEIIVLSQSLNPILTNIDKLRHEYPEARVDLEDLIQEGIINSWALFNRFSEDNRTIITLNRIGRDTLKLGRTKIENIQRQATSEMSSFSNEELEAGEFVVANKMARRITPKEDLPLPSKPEITPELINESRLEKVKNQCIYLLKLATHESGAIAAVVILGIIATLATTAIDEIHKNEVNVKIHDGSGLGIKVGWREVGPIDVTKNIWLGDEEPLVPSQLVNNKSVDITIKGIKSDEQTERLPVVRRDAQGRILNLSDY